MIRYFITKEQKISKQKVTIFQKIYQQGELKRKNKIKQLWFDEGLVALAIFRLLNLVIILQRSYNFYTLPNCLIKSRSNGAVYATTPSGHPGTTKKKCRHF